MNNSIALLVPIFNEERTLGSILERIKSIPGVAQIILVNDGSKDRTREILDEALTQSDGRLVVSHHEKNKGKGAAIQTGIKLAKTDFLVIQDADMEYDTEDLQVIFKMLKEKPREVIFGSRFLKQNPNIYWAYLMGNKIITTFINLNTGAKLTDSYTCYKGMSVENWQGLNLHSNGFEIEAEITTKCLRKGLTITETPINYNPRTFEAGKKIRAVDALKGMIKSLQCR